MTSKFLDAVKLADDADMGKFVKTKSYQLEGEDTWNLFPVENGKTVTEDRLEEIMAAEGKVIAKIQSDVAVEKDKAGYSDADYTLTITAEVVQATKEAVNATFGNGNEFTAPAGCTWELKGNTAE